MTSGKIFHYKVSLGLGVSILGFYLCVTPAHFLTAPDEELNLRTTLSILEGKGGAVPPLEMGFATKTGRNSQEYAQYGIGLPAAAVPWCALGLLIDPSRDRTLNPMENVNEKTSTGTAVLRGWINLFPMLITAFTVVLCEIIFVWMGLSRSRSIFLALLLACTSYMTVHGRTFFTEPLVAFCLTAAVLCLIQLYESPSRLRWVFLAGLFWAYALLTRTDTLVTVPAAAWWLGLQEKKGKVHLDLSIKKWIFFGIPFVLVFGFIIWYNFYRFGSWFSTGYEDQPEKIRFTTPLLVGLHGFLFTPGRSLFLYSPLLIFAVGGISCLWKRNAWFCGGVLILCGGYLMAMSKWQNWAGGFDWGPRHIYQITPFIMLLAAAFFLDRPLFDKPIKRIGWIVLFLLSLFIQFLGLSADPVMTIRRMIYAWPDTPITAGISYHTILQQFSVYLPQFSSPVLHWNLILHDGPDLLFFRWAQYQPNLLWFFMIPLGMMVGGGILIGRNIRESSWRKHEKP